MTITEFAESRGVEAQAVSRYLVRHPEEKANCRKVGKTLELSEEALELLSKQYPLPKPVQIIQGVPHEDYEAVQKSLSDTQEQLSKSKDILLAMKEAMAEKEKRLIQQEANIKLLEDKSAFIEKALEEEKAEKVSIQAKNEALYEEINRLNALLIEANRPKTLFERIFGSRKQTS